MAARKKKKAFPKPAPVTGPTHRALNTIDQEYSNHAANHGDKARLIAELHSDLNLHIQEMCKLRRERAQHPEVINPPQKPSQNVAATEGSAP